MKHKQILITTFILLLIVIFIAIAKTNDDSALIVPVCCANEDGYCMDIGVKKGQNGCGNDHETYTFLSDENFCIKVEECCRDSGNCLWGECYIRDKLQLNGKHKYECIALCKQTGVCTCSGDLNTCTGDYRWEPVI